MKNEDYMNDNKEVTHHWHDSNPGHRSESPMLYLLSKHVKDAYYILYTGETHTRTHTHTEARTYEWHFFPLEIFPQCINQRDIYCSQAWSVQSTKKLYSFLCKEQI